MKKRLEPGCIYVQSLNRLVFWSFLVGMGTIVSVDTHAFAYNLDDRGSSLEVIGSYGRLVEKYFPFNSERFKGAHFPLAAGLANVYKISQFPFGEDSRLLPAVSLQTSVPVWMSYTYAVAPGYYIRRQSVFDAYSSNENHFKFLVDGWGEWDVFPNVTISMVNPLGNEVEHGNTDKQYAESSALFLFGCSILGLAKLVRKKLMGVPKLVGSN